MMGGWAGAHHIETQMIKIDDPQSPLMKSFGSASFEHTDEFYQFPVDSPYSREKQHVLMSIDVEKSDRATGNRFCAPCTRPVLPGEDVRAGRWWWEKTETKECGLHVTPDGRLVRAKETA